MSYYHYFENYSEMFDEMEVLEKDYPEINFVAWHLPGRGNMHVVAESSFSVQCIFNRHAADAFRRGIYWGKRLANDRRIEECLK